jgi:hypothetical protein
MTELLPRMVGLPQREMSLPRGESKTLAGCFPREGPRLRAVSSPRTESKTRVEIRSPAKTLTQSGGILPALVQGVNVSCGGRTCAWRLRQSCIARKHGEIDGRPDDRRYEHKKHDEVVANVRCCWRGRLQRQSPTGR